MVKRKDQQPTLTNLDYSPELPIPCLLSHQGPVCTAAASFVKQDYPMLMLLHFARDPIHRLTKNSHIPEMGQSLMKSSYVFRVNFRPFGSGGFLLRNILNSFMESETWSARLLQVYF